MPMSHKIGRNDPCWCGSGKKYKHCHMREDRAKAEQQAAKPRPESTARPLSPSLPPEPALPPEPEVPPEVAAENARWEQFETAKLEEQINLFQEWLASSVLDAEEAIEMVECIRDRLDVYYSPEDRARYADLLQQLRQKAPDLYNSHIVYYHADLVKDAIADARWNDLPELLSPFADTLDLDLFSHVKEQLMYHGQIRPLIEVMRRAWPKVAASEDFFPWAIEEFATDLSLLILLDYLEGAETPRSDDPALLDAVAPYRQFDPDWLDQIIGHLSAPAPSNWTPDDFGQATDAEQWERNLAILLFEFMADQRRNGVSLSRSELARRPLFTMLLDQMTAPASPRRAKRRGKRGRKRARAARPRSPLIPQYKTLDKALVELFPFLGAQPFRAGAIAELLPAYLHFLARLGLIHPSEMDDALASLRPLIMDHLLSVLQSYGGDPRMEEAVATAWSEVTLASLRDDPALAEARSRPPTIPTPPSPPARRPGTLQTYTFKVTYLDKPSAWGKIEIGETQTLDDLHYAILSMMDFDPDHLYSFFMSGRAWDQDSEYASPYAEGPSAARVKIGDLSLRMKQKFLYLFDYGDEHRFEVQLVAINPDASKDVRYPRILEEHGEPPPQYGEWWDEE